MRKKVVFVWHNFFYIYGFQVKIWNSEEIVKNFKKLNLNNIAYMRTGYLKAKKFDEFQEVFTTVYLA